MMGVAFSLNATFGPDDGIARRAVTDAAAHLVRAHAPDTHAAVAERLAREPDAAFATPRAACDALSAALGEALCRRVTPAAIEGLVRGAGARAAAASFVADAGVRDVLRTLAELNVPRAALGRGWPGIDQWKADAAGFDGQIVGVEADDDEATLAQFGRLAAALRLPADRIFFVATDASMEIRPAALAGMRTIRLVRDGLPARGGRAEAEFAIATLGEVLPIISGPYTQGLLALRHIMRTALDFRDGHFVASDADVLPAAEHERRSGPPA